MAPQYEALIYLNSNCFAFRKENLWGICDQMGNVLHEAQYTYIRSHDFGEVRASTMESYSSKWKVQDNVPSYNDDNVKLCLLNDKGEIAYKEHEIGKYSVRHSGDLYSILTSSNKELISYSLSYVEFITESTAIIKNIEGDSGFFADEKFAFFANCHNIEQLVDGVFKFENIHGNIALGDISGSISDFVYCDIKTVDACHFIAIHKGLQGSSYYVFTDKTGKAISAFFSSIDEFKDGYTNAVFQGRKGVIDLADNMQEKAIKTYGDHTLCEKFENFYFRNKDAEIVSDEYQTIDLLIDDFFIVTKRGETNAKLYSLEKEKATDNSYSKITHLVGNIFVTKAPIYTCLYPASNNVYNLYNGIEPLSTDSYSSIVLLDNGVIALQKTYGKGHEKQEKWKLANASGVILNDTEYDSIKDTNESSFRVLIDGHEGSIDLEGNAIVEKKTCENNYVITHCFADTGLQDSEGNVIFSLDEHISSIAFTGDSILIICNNNKYALYSIDGKQITEYKFTSILYEAKNRYAIVENNVHGHIDSQGNYIESSVKAITDAGIVIFVIKEKYGLRCSNGEVIIPADYTLITFLKENLLVVSKGSRVALFDIEGKALTDFNYTDICCTEDGSIQATRNKIIGRLDGQGKEIEDILNFNGGYLRSLFGEYSVLSDAEEPIVSVGYTKIELLHNDGVFALWKGKKNAIGNISKNKTELIYESAKSIGHGFFVVSRIISKKIRTRQTGYGRRGNPYTYFSSDIVKENKFGIIDMQLRTIIPCKYTSISDFDDTQNITTTNTKGEHKTISLQNLKKKASRTIKLSIDKEYDAKVQSFM